MAEAFTFLESAVESDASMGVMVGHSLSMAWLGEGYLRASQMHEASALAEQAFELARTYQERGNETYALQLLGAIAVEHVPLDAEGAERHYREALALADELGMRPLVAHCHHGLGQLYAKLGQREQARAELTTATGLYRAMEMTFWLPQAEAALAQVEGR